MSKEREKTAVTVVIDGASRSKNTFPFGSLQDVPLFLCRTSLRFLSRSSLNVFVFSSFTASLASRQPRFTRWVFSALSAPRSEVPRASSRRWLTCHPRTKRSWFRNPRSRACEAWHDKKESFSLQSLVMCMRDWKGYSSVTSSLLPVLVTVNSSKQSKRGCNQGGGTW